MIQNENINITIDKNIYAVIFDSSDNIVGELFLDDISELYEDLVSGGFINQGSISQIRIRFEKRDYISESVKVSDIPNKKDEILISNNGLNLEISMGDEPIYVSKNLSRELVTTIVHHQNINNYVFVLENGYKGLSIGDDTSIYYVSYDTEIIDFLIKEESSVDAVVVLNSHTKENLVNFDVYNIDNTSIQKTYGELQDDKFSINDSFFNNFTNNFSVDFSSYENFVRYSSAYSKVSSFEKKMNALSDLRDLKSKNSNSSTLTNINIRIEQIFENLSPFEKYLYEEKYNGVSDEVYDLWLSNEKIIAENYDLQNDEFILYLFPSDIVESDTTGYFTNFVLLMGEFFDSIDMYIQGINDLTRRNFSSNRQIMTQSIKDALYEFGINFPIGFDYVGIQDYFGNSTNFKTLSDTISRRLLYTLPHLYKSKGTLRSLKEIINIFGISEDIISVYEFGGETKSADKMYIDESFDWFLDKKNTSTTSINVQRVDINSSFSFEIVINNIGDNISKLISFDANNYVALESNGLSYRVNVFSGGTSVFTSSYSIENNSKWTYIGFSVDDLNNAIFRTYQEEGSGFGLINANSGSFTWDDSDWSSFSSIELLEDTDAYLLEFRIFNSDLSEEEMVAHARDFKSVVERQLQKTLLVRVKMYNPITSYDSLNAFSGNYTLSMVGVSSEHFKKDQVYNSYEVEMLPSENLNTEMVRVNTAINTVRYLGRSKRTRYKYDSLENNTLRNGVGVFISPTEKINYEILRRVGNFFELIPSDLDEGQHSFSSMNGVSNELLSIPTYYSSDNVYYSLYTMINKNMFKLMKKFVSLSCDFEFGFLIQNNILTKNRGYKHFKSATYDPNYTLSVEGSKTKTILYDSNVDIGTIHRRYKVSEIEIGKDYSGSVILKNVDSDFNDVRTAIQTESVRREFYVNNSIIGRDIPDNEANILKNSGASILIM